MSRRPAGGHCVVAAAAAVTANGLSAESPYENADAELWSTVATQRLGPRHSQPV